MQRTPTNETCAAAAAELGRRLRARGWTLAVAESCTGGLVAAALTSVPGSSGWFEHGVVTYSNRAKTQLLGVPPELIEQHGAVSEAVVEAMARGLRERAGVHITLATSGIAGPGGGTPEKPVGTVWFAWDDGSGRTDRVHFDGDRDAVRRQAVEHALNGLLDLLGTG